MKILYHHRIASKDGQYVHVEEIIHSLRKLGHEVIVCEPDSIRSTKFGEGSGLVQRVRSILPGFVHELAEFFYSFPDYLKIRKLIRRHKPDCIYERYNLYFTSGIWASKGFGLPFLLEVNAPLFSERLKNGGIGLPRLARWSENYVWKNASHVLPVTEVLAKLIEERGVSRNSLTVIHNGISETFFESSPDASIVEKKYNLSGKLVLGFTGFVREWHRLDRVIQFIADNNEMKIHLLLVGDGPDRPRLEAMARAFGVGDHVTFTGIVERQDIPSFVQRFDIALQPDVVDYASPLKIFEYMALAKPIIAPNTSNIREILEDGSNALLFSQHDESFSRSLQRLCSESDFRKKIGNNARRTITDRAFFWDANARKISEIFLALQSRSINEHERAKI